MNEEFNKQLKWAFAEMQGTNAHSMARERPYDGQPHTMLGKRGKEEVKGLTIRDIGDCIVKALLSCGGTERENPIWDDVYSIESLNDIDPVAVVQNTACNIEKMMNISKL